MADDLSSLIRPMVAEQASDAQSAEAQPLDDTVNVDRRVPLEGIVTGRPWVSEFPPKMRHKPMTLRRYFSYRPPCRDWACGGLVGCTKPQRGIPYAFHRQSADFAVCMGVINAFQQHVGGLSEISPTSSAACSTTT